MVSQHLRGKGWVLTMGPCCLVQEAYIVPANTTEMEPPLRKEKLAKTIVFYDGRLVQRPTPFLALITLLWMPVGFILAVLRIAAGALPMSWGYFSSLRLASEW
jgi:hypothetical protein